MLILGDHYLVYLFILYSILESPLQEAELFKVICDIEEARSQHRAISDGVTIQ